MAHRACNSSSNRNAQKGFGKLLEVKQILPLALVLLTAMAARAVEPKAVITGPVAAPTGTMIVLDSKGSVYETSTPIWVLADDRLQALEGVDGKLGLVVGKPGRVCVILIALATESGKAKHAVAKHHIVIGEPGPEPNPPTPVPPGPEPVPPTPLPDGQFGFAAIAYNSAMMVPAAARIKTTALADAFDGTAASIAAGVYSDLNKIMVATRTANDAALGSDKTAWEPVRVAINAHTERLYADKKISTMNDFAIAWREIAVGLRAVKQ
jgi:hypothetical protein